MKENKDLKNTYNKIAEDWHKDHQSDNWWYEGVDKYVSFFKKGDSVLDVGCGCGTKSKYLIEKGLNVTGIDFSENFIDIARKEVIGGEFLVLDMNNVDKLEKTFDGIFIQAVLLHIPKKEVGNLLKEIMQKLKIGGYLYVAVKEKRDGGVDEEIKKENDYGYEYERFFSYFTLDEIKNYFKDVGLRVIFENKELPSRDTRKTNWIQVIGQK